MVCPTTEPFDNDNNMSKNLWNSWQHLLFLYVNAYRLGVLPSLRANYISFDISTTALAC